MQATLIYAGSKVTVTSIEISYGLTYLYQDHCVTKVGDRVKLEQETVPGTRNKLRNCDAYVIEGGVDKSAVCPDWYYSQVPEHLLG